LDERNNSVIMPPDDPDVRIWRYMDFTKFVSMRELAGGMSIAEVIDAHPRLTPDDIYAVIAYAADVVANEDIHFSEPSDAVSGG
jgi:hypothetical protein